MTAPIDESIDRWVTGHRDELLQFLARLVQTPSEVRPPLPGGERACQAIVEAAYREAGARVDVFTPDEVPELRSHPAFFGTWDGLPRTFVDRPDVVGVFPGRGGGRSLLLSAHVDTVGREPLPWQVAAPFSGTVLDGRLYGRGSWDTKWGIAAGLYAARCVQGLDIPLRGDVIVESVVDEEYGGAHGCLAARLRGYNADFAINCEPTGMEVCPAHRGGGEWRIVVRGDAGMSFAGETQVNPVYALARVIEGVREFDRQRNAHRQPPRFYEQSPALPAYTLQIGGGGDSYADVSGIPPECYLIVWVEEYPGVGQEEHRRHFVGFLNDFLARDPQYEGPLPDFRPTIRYLPGTSVDPAHPFFGALEKAFCGAGAEYRLSGAPLACDTFVFNLYSPTPAITIGPRGGNAHAADEYVLVEDVLTLTRIYARAIAAWCA